MAIAMMTKAEGTAIRSENLQRAIDLAAKTRDALPYADVKIYHFTEFVDDEGVFHSFHWVYIAGGKVLVYDEHELRKIVRVANMARNSFFDLMSGVQASYIRED